MGKSLKFTFAFSKRKNASSPTEIPPTPPQFTKAQRILGADSISLNIPSSNSFQHSEDPSNKFPVSHSPIPTLNSSHSPRFELCGEQISANEKASSIQGIGRHQLEDDRCSTMNVHSRLAQIKTKLRPPKMLELWERPSTACARPSFSSLKEKSSLDLRVQNIWEMKEDKSSFSRSLAHIALYLDQPFEHMAELPADDIPPIPNTKPKVQDSPPYRPQSIPQSLPSSAYRAESSQSSPPTQNNKDSLSSTKLSDTSPVKVATQSNLASLKSRPTSRSRFNRQIPSQEPYQLGESCISEIDCPATSHAVEKVENRSPPEPYPVPPVRFYVGAGDKEEEDNHPDPETYVAVPMVLRSTRDSMMAQISNLKPLNTTNTPYLTIPELIDTKLSGPWNESEEKSYDQKKSQDNFTPDLHPPCNNPPVLNFSAHHISSEPEKPHRLKSLVYKCSNTFHESTQRISGSTAVEGSEYDSGEALARHYSFKSHKLSNKLDLGDSDCHHVPLNIISQAEQNYSLSSRFSSSTLVDDKKVDSEFLPLSLITFP